MWNSLPSKVVEASSIECLKRRMDVILAENCLTYRSAYNRFVYFLFINCVYTVRMYIYRVFEKKGTCINAELIQICAE